MKIDKKLIVGVISLLSLSLVIYFSVNYFVKSDEEEKDEAVYQDEAKEKLPNNPNASDNPVLYDFVYSSIGYMSNIKPEEYGGISYAILIKNKTLEDDTIKEGTAHILEVNLGDVFPPVSSGYISIKFDASRWELIKDSIKDWPELYKFEENDYTLVIVRQSQGEKSQYTYDPSTKGSIWQDIDLGSLDYPKGWLAKHVDDGWPTSWLRQQPYKDKIKSYHNEDMDNKFFDVFRMHEIIELENTNGEGDETRKVKVLGVDKFKTIDKPIWKMSLQQMNAQLKEEGYETIDR